MRVNLSDIVLYLNTCLGFLSCGYCFMSQEKQRTTLMAPYINTGNCHHLSSWYQPSKNVVTSSLQAKKERNPVAVKATPPTNPTGKKRCESDAPIMITQLIYTEARDIKSSLVLARSSFFKSSANDLFSGCFFSAIGFTLP